MVGNESRLRAKFIELQCTSVLCFVPGCVVKCIALLALRLAFCFYPVVFFQVLDEIYSHCDHVAPWAPGTSRVPSSAFCLLMKLFTLKLTRPQMNEILMHEVCGETPNYSYAD